MEVDSSFSWLAMLPRAPPMISRTSRARVMTSDSSRSIWLSIFTSAFSSFVWYSLIWSRYSCSVIISFVEKPEENTLQIIAPR